MPIHHHRQQSGIRACQVIHIITRRKLLTDMMKIIKEMDKHLPSNLNEGNLNVENFIIYSGIQHAIERVCEN